MIARIWRGIVRANAAEEYLRHLRERILPAYGTAGGNDGIHILFDTQGEFATVLLLSFWESRAALEAFHEPQGADEFLLASEAAAVYVVADEK
jgi:heme-degrading monooxygenase HmoA